MRQYYLEWELPQYEKHRSPATLDEVLLEKLWSFLRAYFGSVILIAPVLAAIVWRDRLGIRALLVAVLFTLIVFGNLWFFPHYAAPAGIVSVLIIVQGLRRLRAVSGGRWIVRGILALHVLASIVWIAQLDRTRSAWYHRRADLVASARAEGRKLLVIVRPGPDYYAHNEWVYNDADIDGSAVVFARDMGDDANRRLLAYFSDREALLLEIDANSMKLDPYRAP
jgi:hypothetical protein